MLVDMLVIKFWCDSKWHHTALPFIDNRSLFVGASPPKDLRVVVPVYGNHGDLLVTWSYEACRSPNEGYVMAFELMYCQLNGDKQCIGR